MVILNKIRGATLVETLVASALIVLVFLMASLCFNNIFESVVKNNTAPLHTRIAELQYLTEHQKVDLPFYEESPVWNISIQPQGEKIILEASFKPNELKNIYLEIVPNEE